MPFERSGSREQQRDQPESRNEGGQQHRAQTPLCTLNDDVARAHPLVVQLIEIADQHDTVEDSYTKQRDEAHRRHRADEY